MMDWDWSVVIEYKDLFIQGLITTIELTAVAVAVGLVIGVLLGIMLISAKKWLRIPARVYVHLFRGTPLFLQILFFHFAVLPTLAEMFFMDPPEAVISGFVAFSMNAGAYIAEIFRGGIQSVDKGQLEAARSLGMTYPQAMRFVVLPQAFKNMLPPLGNEMITLLKDTSLVTVIAVNDITYAAFVTAKNTFVRWTPYITAGLVYLVLTTLLTQWVSYLEKRFQTSKR
ncbi:amino acid ABC transporter permease [Thermoactinomyces intermedius]|jgi:glutamine transport system permease protein|nr:amino acid ABC transporter permease [Thermoactinomyces intermedius]MBA4548190.1 amino acid ABC transporter permease [Thermoactinomyces intermedius]MBA4835246.1 amino acid ABC transporter permease [Thermoactinomyces intermedius]